MMFDRFRHVEYVWYKQNGLRSVYAYYSFLLWYDAERTSEASSHSCEAIYCSPGQECYDGVDEIMHLKRHVRHYTCHVDTALFVGWTKRQIMPRSSFCLGQQLFQYWQRLW